MSGYENALLLQVIQSNMSPLNKQRTAQDHSGKKELCEVNTFSRAVNS